MTDQKTTNDKSAQDASAETGAQDPAGLDKAANGGAIDDSLSDVLAEADAETRSDVETQDPSIAMIAERDRLKDQRSCLSLHPLAAAACAGLLLLLLLLSSVSTTSLLPRAAGLCAAWSGHWRHADGVHFMFLKGLSDRIAGSSTFLPSTMPSSLPIASPKPKPFSWATAAIGRAPTTAVVKPLTSRRRVVGLSAATRATRSASNA